MKNLKMKLLLYFVMVITVVNRATSVCDNYWKSSPAAKSCSLEVYSYNQQNGQCEITAQCGDGNGQSIRGKIFIDGPGAAQLVNCDGSLAYRNCKEINPTSSTPKITSGSFDQYWNLSAAAKTCHLKSFSYNQYGQCEIFAECLNEYGQFIRQVIRTDTYGHNAIHLVNCNGNLAFENCKESNSSPSTVDCNCKTKKDIPPTSTTPISVAPPTSTNPLTRTCDYYWNLSAAAKNCILESYYSQQNGVCEITAKCCNEYGQFIRKKIYVFSTLVTQLVNCDGHLAYENNCKNTSPGSITPVIVPPSSPTNPTAGTCDYYWNLSSAVKSCYIERCIPYRDGKCEISAKCPDEYGQFMRTIILTYSSTSVIHLVNCNGHLSFKNCESTSPDSTTPMIVQTPTPRAHICMHHWNLSPAAKTCYLNKECSDQNGQCELTAMCRDDWGRYIQTFTSINYAKAAYLVNCNGNLVCENCCRTNPGSFISKN